MTNSKLRLAANLARVYHMDTKTELENSYSKKDKKQEIKNCQAFLTQFYKNFKEL